MDRERVTAAVRELLSAIGADPDSPELTDTPARVADAYGEFFSGVGQNPVELLADAVPVGNATGELVVLRNVSLRSMCEHHLLPFRGLAHIAYRPAERVVGLSALARVVDLLAARPQVQERLGEQIVQALVDGLAPHGVLVVLEASHGCIADRGVRQIDAVTATVASRGVLADPSEQAVALSLFGAPSGGVS